MVFRLLNYSRVCRNFSNFFTKMLPRSRTNLGNVLGRLISWNGTYWRKSPSRLASNYDSFDSHSRTTGKLVICVCEASDRISSPILTVLRNKAS